MNEFLEVTVSIDGDKVSRTLFGPAQCREAESFCDGIAIVAKHLPLTDVAFVAQFHNHGTSKRRCDCSDLYPALHSAVAA